MSENIFSGVEDTLFIPLIARIEISKKFPEFFCDKKALSLESVIPQGKISEKSSEYSMMASVSRAYVMDKAVVEFIKRNTDSNIVCIGCGLETMAWRIAEKIRNARFYEMDFETVIQNREKILGVLDNETLISGNANEVDFSAHMDVNLPTLFVVAGVFQYFKENEVLGLIKKLQDKFPHAELIFDATDDYGIKYAEKYVKKTGNKNAMMYFYINDSEEFAKKSGTKLLSQTGFFDDARKILKKKTELFTKFAMRVADKKKRTRIIRLSL